MSILNQTYKELSIPYFKEAFDSIDTILQKHNIPYYLIGVSAIALELLKSNIKPSRGTKDIDFAIMIATLDQFQQLSESLQEVGFNKVEAPWTFYSDTFNLVIDILPFGEIEEQDTEQFNQRHTDLHVLGLKEVLEEAIQVEIENKIANIPPLPGMIILKLVAWSDRPEERKDDLPDILRIIEHYFELEFDEIVEFHNDTFPEEDILDPLKVAAEVLGRKSQIYLNKSPKLAERIYKVLDDNLIDETQSYIAKNWAQKKDWEIEYAFTILKAFQKGLYK